MHKLRERLRADTATAHQALDDALGVYDLTRVTGVSNYLSVHYLARLHLCKYIEDTPNRWDNACRLSDLKSDLSALTCPLPHWGEGLSVQKCHMLGLTYVIAGSSLGSKILYKRWLCATNERVKKAGRFLESSRNSVSWNKFLEDINEADFTEGEVQQIVAAANHGFSIFQVANNQVMKISAA